MKEFNSNLEYRVENVDISKAEELFLMAEKSLRDPRVADPVEKAMLESIVTEVLTGDKLLSQIEQSFAFRRSSGSFFPTGYALRTLEFAIDKQMRKLFPADVYPIDFADASSWQGNNVFNNLDYFELSVDMEQNLRSNVQLGYEIFKLVSNALKDRWNYNPTVVDAGASLGLGLKKWSMHDSHPFKPIQVLSKPVKGQPISPFLPTDYSGQEAVNLLASSPPIIGQAFGYDNFPMIPGDHAAENLVFSHTFPMSESLRDKEGVKEFNDLIKSNPANVELIERHIDATEPDSLKQLADYLPNGKADIFTFSAVLFEMEPEKTLKVFENIRPYCNEGAICIVSEFVKPDTKSAIGLKFIREDWWHRAGSFATFIVDPFNLEQPPIEICRYVSRRCEQMWLSDAGRELFKLSSS